MNVANTPKTFDDLFFAHQIRFNADVSRGTGIVPQEISQIRRGTREVFTRGIRGPSEAERLAQFFGVSVEEIVAISKRTVEAFSAGESDPEGEPDEEPAAARKS